MSDYSGNDRRRVSQQDIAALSEQVSDLDNTIRTLFLTKADAHAIFPNWNQVNRRLSELEERVNDKRAHRLRQVAFVVAVGLLVWTPFVAYMTVQIQDNHMENCGPANRPTTRTEKAECDRWSIGHDHPYEHDVDAELADRLLRSIGLNPEEVRSRNMASTTTTAPP